MAENTPAVPAQPNPTPPAAGAAPVSPAVAQRFADPDMLYRGNIYGKEQIVPVKVLAEGWQSKEASRLALEEAKRIRADQHIDREHAERWRRLEHDLKTNPEQALAGLERLSGVTRKAQFDSPDQLPVQAADDTKTRALDERLRAIEERQNQAALKTRVNEVLDNFELFKQDPEARGIAETQILAMQIVDAASDPLEIATRIHTRELARGSATATQQRDQRQANQKAMPNIPASVGMPDLSDIPVGKDGDVKDGTFKQNFMRAAERFRAFASGQQV